MNKRVVGNLAVALCVLVAASVLKLTHAQGDKPVVEKWTGPVTLVTSGKVTRSNDDKKLITVSFAAADSSLKALSEVTSKKAKGESDNRRKTPIDPSDQISTNGAFVISKDEKGTTVEVINFAEFKERYPDLVKANPKLAAAGGFCSLMGGGGNYRCEKATCTGSCKLHNIPVYCSCD